jgi:two-component system cell cycle response regulator
MSFRTRLGLFFLLMVAIPIAAIAVLASDVTGDSQAGKADAQVSTGLEAAISVYEENVATADRAAKRVVADGAFASALANGSPEKIKRAATVAGAENDLEYLAITTPDGDELEPIRSAAPVATATITDDAGGEFRLVASTTSASEYLGRIEELTGLRAAVVGGDGEAVAAEGVDTASLPDSGETADSEIDGADARAATAALGEESSVTVFAPVAGAGFFDSRPRVALLVAVFLAVALTGVAVIARTLQSQIAAMFGAAKRIGSGDFSQRVPVVGRDEMAGLASEFNKMTDQLEEQIGQLRRQRTELDRSVQRLGEAFAAGLDRDTLLGIVAETALGACDAEYARVSLDDGHIIEVPNGFKGPARDAAVAGQKRVDREGSNIDVRRDEGFALAAPLKTLSDSVQVGSLSIGRSGATFADEERNVFLYLLGQTSVSIENISAHERVSEQAVTDELTGLPNNRAFRETIDREASRAERFDHELSLIILDVDNFKSVNDTYGHLQGDEVLRLIGKLLLEEPRAIDEPARYGGEEFVVALPETGTEGAVEMAERIRERLAEEEIPLLDGSGVLKVTASFGTATVPLSAATVRQLFAAADDALYEAKRTGKNRVVTAPERVGVRS